jgi:hypothetical protein
MLSNFLFTTVGLVSAFFRPVRVLDRRTTLLAYFDAKPSRLLHVVLSSLQLTARRTPSTMLFRYGIAALASVCSVLAADGMLQPRCGSLETPVYLTILKIPSRPLP